MIQVLLILWIASAFLIIHERKFAKMILFLSVFSLITSLCFLLSAAPDVAMAEAVISVFSTIIFIVSFEKYFSLSKSSVPENKKSNIINHLIHYFFSVFLFSLFISFIPQDTANSYLKDQYLLRFSQEIGGKNAVTAIYLGYRLYDTLFEALILLISISGIIHLSWYKDFFISQERYISIKRSQIAVVTIRVICPVLILYGIYIMMNGHISPGGGFQGGVIAASFFICRYMIHDIYDIPIGKVLKLEKLFYIGLIVLAACFIFLAANTYLQVNKNIYLILMNLLIGIKVALGFLVISYRFIAFERQ